MIGSRIPNSKRLINRTPPVNPADLSEANANNYMFLFDNISSGDYIEDAAISTRHLNQLFAREQASPNMTLEVLAGIAWFTQNSYVSFAGGNSPTFVAPSTHPRIDILTLRNDGTLRVVQGSEAVSPTPPIIPSSDIPLAQVYNVVGETVIHDNDEQVGGQGYIKYDMRPFVQIAVGGSAMPKIGLVGKVQASQPSSGSLDVVNFSGAGRLRAVHWTGGSGIAASITLTITIDGVVVCALSPNAPIVHRDIVFSPAGSVASNILIDQAGSSSSRVFLDAFFKSSLVVSIQQDQGGGTLIGTVEYEHE